MKGGSHYRSITAAVPAAAHSGGAACSADAAGAIDAAGAVEAAGAPDRLVFFKPFQCQTAPCHLPPSPALPDMPPSQGPRLLVGWRWLPDRNGSLVSTTGPLPQSKPALLEQVGKHAVCGGALAWLTGKQRERGQGAGRAWVPCNNTAFLQCCKHCMYN